MEDFASEHEVDSVAAAADESYLCLIPAFSFCSFSVV